MPAALFTRGHLLTRSEQPWLPAPTTDTSAAPQDETPRCASRGRLGPARGHARGRLPGARRLHVGLLPVRAIVSRICDQKSLTDETGNDEGPSRVSADSGGLAGASSGGRRRRGGRRCGGQAGVAACGRTAPALAAAPSPRGTAWGCRKPAELEPLRPVRLPRLSTGRGSRGTLPVSLQKPAWGPRRGDAAGAATWRRLCLTGRTVH